MNDPIRWLNDDAVPQELRGLLPLGASDLEMPDAAFERVAARLALPLSVEQNGVSAGHTSTVVGAPVATAPVNALLLKGLLGVSLLGGVAGTAALQFGNWHTEQKPVASVAADSRVARSKTPASGIAHSSTTEPSVALSEADATGAVASVQTVPTPVSNVLEVTDLPKLPDTSKAAPRRHVQAAGAPAASLGTDLNRQVEHLRKMKSLVSRDPGAALRSSQEYRALYGVTQFETERRVLELRARLALGQRAEVERLAQQFLQEPTANLYHAQLVQILNAAKDSKQ